MTLQRGPASEVDDFTAVFVEGRAVVLGVVDIEADVEYVRVHRRLLGSRGQVVASTAKVFLFEDSPQFW
jgi:hypothetical protein